MIRRYIFSLYRIIPMWSIIILIIMMIGNLSGMNRQKVTYSLEIDEEKWNSYYISITIENNRNDHLLFQLPTWEPGIYTKRNFHEEVIEFKAVGDVIDELPVTKTNSNSWLIKSNSLPILLINIKDSVITLSKILYNNASEVPISNSSLRFFCSLASWNILETTQCDCPIVII